MHLNLFTTVVRRRKEKKKVLPFFQFTVFKMPRMVLSRQLRLIHEEPNDVQNFN